MMKKRGILLAGLVLILFLVSCTNKVPVSETPQEPVPEETNIIVEEAAAIPEESPPIEREANLTDATSQKQDVTLNQSAVQETEVQEIKVQEPKCSREFSPQFNAGTYYTGSLFDAHFHMPLAIDLESEEPDSSNKPDSFPEGVPILGKDVTIDQILCFFDEEKTKGVIGFYDVEIIDDFAVTNALQTARNIKNLSSGRISLFLMPILMPANFDAQKLDNIQNANADLFEGYGEIAFYVPTMQNSVPDDEQFLGIYRLADKHKLPVMIHPARNQENRIENAARQNPNVKFLIHGPEAEDYITDLIEEYPNVYYSIDAILIRVPPIPGGLIYTTNTKEEFKTTFTQKFDVLLNRAVKDWKAKIEQHPDRFVWGTDRAYTWHHDEEVSVLLEEFGRAFIGRLDQPVQEKFAYQNAERLLK